MAVPVITSKCLCVNFGNASPIPSNTLIGTRNSFARMDDGGSFVERGFTAFEHFSHLHQSAILVESTIGGEDFAHIFELLWRWSGRNQHPTGAEC